MRLHRLTLTGVGPFKDRQEIDFDELASSGLFLIEGPTGSGKTTIIDAIVYALFGVVSAGGDDVTKMRIRSHYCDEGDPTGVACEFSVDGRRHRVTRVPAGARDPEDPATKAKSKGVRQTLVEYDADGGERRILTIRKEIDEHISTLLGMTAEQFRQLVVLPQGQFAELLRKTPADRMTSLAPLLEDTFLAAVQDDLDQQGRLARERRQTASVQVDQAAQRLVGRLEQWLPQSGLEVDVTDSSLSDDDRADAVTLITETLAAQSAAAEQVRADQAERTDVARRAALEAADLHAALVALAEAQQAAAEARAALDPADADIDEATAAGRLADLNQRAGALAAHASWEALADDRRQDRERASADAARAREEAARLEAERAGLPARRADTEAELAIARTAAVGLTAARTEVERLLAVSDALRGLDERRLALAHRDAELAAAEEQERAAQVEAEAADQRWRELLGRQHAGAAAALSALLADGAPCPVCGSADHPHPAQGAADAIDESDVASAQSDAERLRSLVRAAADRVRRVAVARTETATALAVAEAAVGEHDAPSVEAALTIAQEQVDTAAAGQAAIPELEESLRLLAAADTDLIAAVAEHTLRATSLETTVATQVSVEEERTAEIAALVGPGLTATQVRDHTLVRADQVAAVMAAWQHLGEVAARVPDGGVLLSIDDAATTAQEAAAALSAAEAELARATADATALTLARDGAAPLADALRAALDRRRAVHDETAAAIGLAALVTADNPRRLQLRSYALQRRFEAVLSAASVHLERMSRGKFRFELSEETAKSGQSGLGISLFDSWTGHPQDPKSLSGGETFYASLALALGLADVVRGEAGGSALETLFVDEGFGSLDQDTLYEVLDQLDELRAGRRAVGVVSHVTEMKESIPDRIEVRRQADSTSIVVRSGSV